VRAVSRGAGGGCLDWIKTRIIKFRRGADASVFRWTREIERKRRLGSNGPPGRVLRIAEQAQERVSRLAKRRGVEASGRRCIM
jgi:hypothetical protein